MADEDPKIETTPETVDFKALIESLVQKMGSPDGAMTELLRQTHDLRRKNAELRGKLPKDGSLVLEGEDAKAWSKYRELGDPKNLKDAIAERDTFKVEAETFRKKETISEAAKVHGYNPAVLGRLAKDLDIEVREEKGKDGKPAKVALVKDGDAEPISLDKYADTHWQEFTPALKPSATTPILPPRPTLPERNGGPKPKPEGESRVPVGVLKGI